ncbi:hypothetical protein P691DRAFT_767399 [Macrolepiota fuliginosa MF-IS2]|uniref:Uncharacterized protein n=1 Tax=Macrolepiota fuliginosa MF-IS2 TaxID=1400762 RepID=A0A9P5WY82_9AGAR|nr:hypothetical protein P691DRAFT_767399 [Macrolepiota fuliginosa MF-IS2]
MNAPILNIWTMMNYLMQDFNDWIARLYNQPGIKDYLDHGALGGSDPSGAMADIWDAPIMKDFKDHDGKPFF